MTALAPAPAPVRPLPSTAPAPATSSRPAASLIVAALAAAAMVTLALSGGAYDVVVRQTAGLVVWWSVALGALLLPAPRRPAPAGLAVLACAAGIGLWIALNLGHTVSQERSATELARAVAHLGPLILIGWVMPARLWRSVIAGAVTGGVIVICLALLSRLYPSLAGELQTLSPANTLLRLSFPLGYWNAIGSWGAITIVALLAISAHHPRPAVRGMALAPIPMAAAAVYLTYSRAAILVTLVGIVVALGCSRHRWTFALHTAAALAAGAVAVLAVRAAPEIAKATGTAGGTRVLVITLAAGALLGLLGAFAIRLRTDRLQMPVRAGRAVAAGTLIVAVLAGGAAASHYGADAWRQFNNPNGVDLDDPSARLTSLNGTRVEQWRAALDRWQEDPARGSGAGTFELTWNVQATNSEFVRDAHNAYIEALSEQGTIGLLALLGFVAALAASAIVAVRRTTAALDRGLIAAASAGAAMFVVGTAVDWYWEVTALATYVLILAGALLAAGKPETGGVPRRPWLVRTTLIAVSVLAILVQLPGLVGMSEVRRSQAAAADGDLARAQRLADDATQILPWAASPLAQRSLVEEARGDWVAARRSLQSAIRRDPQEWRYPLMLSRVEAGAGEYDAALRAYRQAKALRPRGGFLRSP